MMEVSSQVKGEEVFIRVKITCGVTKRQKIWLEEELGITEVKMCQIDKEGKLVSYVYTNGPKAMLKDRSYINNIKKYI